MIYGFEPLEKGNNVVNIVTVGEFLRGTLWCQALISLSSNLFQHALVQGSAVNSFKYKDCQCASLCNVNFTFDLKSCYMAYEEVTEDNVYTCVGHPLRSDIENIVTWMLNENFKKAYNSILTKAKNQYPTFFENGPLWSLTIYFKNVFTVIECVHFLNDGLDIMNLKSAKGLALQDILTEVHHYVHRSKRVSLIYTVILHTHCHEDIWV